MIQKNIYLAAKKHDFNYVNELQKYLMNSNDVKVICLKHILDKVTNKNIEFNSSKMYSKRNIYPRTIHFLLEKYLLVSKNLLLVNRQIKNHLIYLCITPVNKAKFKSKYYLSKYLSENNTNYTQYLIYFYNNYKCSLAKLIVDRLNSCEYINALVISLIYSKNMYSLLTIDHINFQKNLLSKFNKINDLVLNSLLIDKFWLFFRVKLKKNYNEALVNIVNINSNIAYYKSIITKNGFFNVNKQFNNFLGEKIYRKLKIFYILNYNLRFINDLIKKYLRYYQEFNIFASIHLLKYNNTFINIFLYTYYNRRQEKVLNPFLKLIELNYFFNLLTYYYNILNFYIF